MTQIIGYRFNKYLYSYVEHIENKQDGRFITAMFPAKRPVDSGRTKNLRHSQETER